MSMNNGASLLIFSVLAMLHVHFNSNLDGLLVICLGDNTNKLWFFLSRAALDRIIYFLHFIIPHSAGLF